MKQIISVIIIVVTSLCSFAQQVNERGLKCVKELEVGKPDIHGHYSTKYVFEYFDDLSLKSVSVYSHGKFYRGFTRTPDGIKYQDGNGYSDTKYVCVFNAHGNIIKVTRSYGNSADVLEYSYAKSDRNPWEHVVKKTESSIYKGRRSYDWVYKFDYPDGTICAARMPYDEAESAYYFEKNEDQFNKNVKNDTNIDFWEILGDSWYTDIVDSDLALTEWLCFRPDYLMNSTENYTFKYEYDESGNLVRILRIDYTSDEYEINIKYLY